ncbi:MAG: SdiA-regulated domain-containing protein [Saprospiraceae bacterium]|nr:SdiA-regulated domain-containing protein [Saprospiraceae bacterium]MCF8252689.1 SdiA-regulated domain-containing protein [Saprospiraceae bacterium]MCF8282996.1 SdiA-regulated domain-containing protein [Bacteroidales bacterium]MCF8314262.1 SdiA-regulated domain-containing protein [Saprospiraceae bacterium]MCF8443095.1 SdiA-regulated domain-containing protein [Saprospiraceae bacterium]
MRIATFIFLLLAIGIIATSCFLSKKKKKKTDIAEPVPTAVFPYQVNAPTKEIELPHKLREISDLSFDATANALWAIADEHGVAFRIGLSGAGPIDAFPFGKDGDYEGVELVGNTVYAMESNGRITRILNASSANPEKASFENPSLAGDDIEAFMYDPKRQKLVLGVKTPAGGGEVRPFYALDPATMKLEPTPIFQISLGDIQAFLRKNGLEGDQYEHWFKKKAEMPSPSAVAIQPQTGHYFILCSIGKTLLVTQPDGVILQVVALDKDVHAQPEGIAFDAQGTLYISNEANGGMAKLYAFAPQ